MLSSNSLISGKRGDRDKSTRRGNRDKGRRTAGRKGSESKAAYRESKARLREDKIRLAEKAAGVLLAIDERMKAEKK